MFDAIIIGQVNLNNGLPSLTGTNAERVRLANKVYDNICKILQLMGDSCIISVENLTRAHMWSTSWLRKLIKRKQLFPFTFQACMHGSWRDKWTTFYANYSGFSSLALTCDGNHPHLPWGVDRNGDGWRFHASDEAEYPPELCAKIADIILQAAQNRNVVMVSQQINARVKHGHSQIRAAESGRQPRGNLLPQIIPEFGEILQLQWPQTWSANFPRMLRDFEHIFRFNVMPNCCR